MIYIKRIANADITRQIDLNKESALFFGFDEESKFEILLEFEDEETNEVVTGTVKKTGHTTTITGEIFSEVKERCNLSDIIVFSSTRNKFKFKYFIVSKSSNQYKQFDESLKLFGSHSSVINASTHLVASYEESVDDTSISQISLKQILEDSEQLKILQAMRTKPFLLLAGISGTGKSRIVKQMAFESCPKLNAKPELDPLRKDPTSPGNYQLIEVKPNWHDSTEVLGYESEIGGSHYVVTPFVKFLVKAMQYEDKAPFFVCMDEMNLAPVEQYFAEFLSVLESRKLINGKITSEPLIKADIFVKYESSLKAELFNLPKETSSSYGNATSDTAELYGEFNEIYKTLKKKGLRIPSNLIVVGTVNMDETTHQFSRKVIDRAMTIEMNIEDSTEPFVNFFKGGDALHYYEDPQLKELFLPKVVQAADALAQLKEDAEYIKEEVPKLLSNLNKALDGTPFKIAYRVQNELVLYFYSLREEKPEETAEKLLASAMDAILMMKVLPRIEGDEDLLEKPLKALAEFTANYEETSKAKKKIAEMQQRLPQAHFTSFWP